MWQNVKKKKISITQQNNRVELTRSDFVCLTWHSPIFGQRFGRGTETTTSSSRSLDSPWCWHHDGQFFLEICLCGREDGLWWQDGIISKLYREERKESKFRLLNGKWRKTWHRNVTIWQTDMYFLFACKYIYFLNFYQFLFCLCFINWQRWNPGVPLGTCFHPACGNKCFESWIPM